jgi:hypothetical protein
MQIEIKCTEVQLINKFPSTELCDREWNSIREKEFPKRDLKDKIILPTSNSMNRYSN